MLDEDVRKTILKLAENQHGVRAIARMLHLSRGAVRGVIKSGSAHVPAVTRAQKAERYEADIRELYVRCKGNLVRVHEELVAQGATLSYQALTGFCRRRGIGQTPIKPAGRYHFDPGQEMQHDTSPHVASIGGVQRRVQTASVVLCYSRMLYFQLYPTFNRFLCKTFLTDAVKYFGGACKDCMIDNTHVVVLRGTGKNMVPVPEMETFAQRLNFCFIAHEKGDANRSARVERPFDFIENNFLAGRTFTDFEHANREAVAWCDKVNGSFKKHLRARPRELFAVESPVLRPLPAWIPDVYMLHQRIVDLEGYVHVGGHLYSVPFELIGKQVEVRETKSEVRIFVGPRLVASHSSALGSIKTRSTLAEHRPPRGQATAQRQLPEEIELLAAEAPLPDYAARLKKSHSRWPVALRRLSQMRRDYPQAAFLAAVQSALHYGLYDLERLERMVLRNIATEYFVVRGRPNTEDDVDEG